MLLSCFETLLTGRAHQVCGALLADGASRDTRRRSCISALL